MPTPSALPRPVTPRDIARRFGWSLRSDVIQRRLDGGLTRARLGPFLQALAPADLARCLSKEPAEAVQFLFTHLELMRQAVRLGNVDRPGQYAWLIDDAAPNSLKYGSSSHGRSSGRRKKTSTTTGSGASKAYPGWHRWNGRYWAEETTASGKA